VLENGNKDNYMFNPFRKLFKELHGHFYVIFKELHNHIKHLLLSLLGLILIHPLPNKPIAIIRQDLINKEEMPTPKLLNNLIKGQILKPCLRLQQMLQKLLVLIIGLERESKTSYWRKALLACIPNCILSKRIYFIRVKIDPL